MHYTQLHTRIHAHTRTHAHTCTHVCIQTHMHTRLDVVLIQVQHLQHNNHWNCSSGFNSAMSCYSVHSTQTEQQHGSPGYIGYILVPQHGYEFDLSYRVRQLCHTLSDRHTQYNTKYYIHVVLSSINIYIYNSVLTCRQHIINSSASAPPNATKIAVKKVSDVDDCMFGPEF